MQVLGASFDSIEANRRFAEKEGFPFPLLSDPTREIGIAYGAASAPDQKSAKRVSVLIGPDGKVEKFYPKVSPAAHPAEVLADVAAAAAR